MVVGVRAQLLSSIGMSPFENVPQCYQIFKLFRGSCNCGFFWVKSPNF